MSEPKGNSDGIFEVSRIRKLVELMKEHDLSEIDLRESRQRIRICRGPKDAPRVAYGPPPPPPPPPEPVQPAVPQPPPPPQFTYHYIGTFGTAASPIATFSGDGKIVNVHVGDTIDDKFILRSIGIESVEIGYVGFPADVKTRIAIGQ